MTPKERKLLLETVRHLLEAHKDVAPNAVSRMGKLADEVEEDAMEAFRLAALGERK